MKKTKEFLRCIKKLFIKKKKKEYSDKEIYNYSIDLIKCAEYDLNATKTLNSKKNKNYSIILYHIQQCVEKLTKAELVLRKSIRINELIEINHKTPDAFMKALFHALQDKEIGSFISQYVPDQKIKEAKRLIKNPTNIINSSKQEIERILNYYDYVKKSNLPKDLYENAKSKISPDKLKKFSQKRADVFMNLFFLSWITFPYAVLTRYPNKNLNPWEINDKIPLVKFIPQIINKLENIQYEMKNYKLEVGK